MSRYSDNDTYSQAADWLLGAARRNPEALLLLAAGCLMMRSGSVSSRGASLGRSDEDNRNSQSSAGRPSSSSGFANCQFT
jgi:hypothetical protein